MPAIQKQRAFSANRLTAKVLPRINDGTIEAMKWFALLLMLADHINKHFFNAKLPGVLEAGRLCFPLFGFVLAYNLARPGAFASGAYLRVLSKLMIFGLLATPFYMALGGLIQGWWPMNIMFTLFAATAVIYLIDSGCIAKRILAAIVFFCGGFFVEYFWMGIVFCVGAWWFCRTASPAATVFFIAAIFSLYAANNSFWAVAALPLIFYAPKLDFKVPRFRYAFYAFYPAHLAALFVFKVFLNA